MSLDQKIGQLFMLPAYSNKNEEHEQQLLEAIKKYHIGGIIFFQGTPVKQALMTNRFQAVTKIPLFIGMDAEGGVGWRIKPAIEFPNQTLQGAIRDTNLIFRIG
ncbi:MAG: glycoside hydrolase family 3 N-terminal domain-containing protein, partial [Marinifilaceae bacterium]|nr:glycoside hydrolase family 3 N-terminal domain-containing protein [Marinifilaceae bacterium]